MFSNWIARQKPRMLRTQRLQNRSQENDSSLMKHSGQGQKKPLTLRLVENSYPGTPTKKKQHILYPGQILHIFDAFLRLPTCFVHSEASVPWHEPSRSLYVPGHLEDPPMARTRRFAGRNWGLVVRYGSRFTH